MKKGGKILFVPYLTFSSDKKFWLTVACDSNDNYQLGTDKPECSADTENWSTFDPKNYVCSDSYYDAEEDWDYLDCCVAGLNANDSKAMFRNGTSLTAAPELPATSLADNDYENMFMVCTGLTSAPELKAAASAPIKRAPLFLPARSGPRLKNPGKIAKSLSFFRETW